MQSAQLFGRVVNKSIKSSPPVGLTVLGRGASHDLNEFADKIVAVLISDILGNSVYLLIRIDDLPGSFPDPVICQVILKRHPVFFSEDLSQIGIIDMVFVSKILQADIVRIVFLYLRFHFGKYSV